MSPSISWTHLKAQYLGDVVRVTDCLSITKDTRDRQLVIRSYVFAKTLLSSAVCNCINISSAFIPVSLVNILYAPILSPFAVFYSKNVPGLLISSAKPSIPALLSFALVFVEPALNMSRI